ncbi:cysteine-rich CWC family protein [Janthinobacterium sp.]|uniref:cysteine-rich CWC family protein n=1 Tax=Janthinobacterium sp. TaxID=1871054 RepID=UPI00289EBEF1|nr:cysteine-rich CWC family protein [Janthinobacterium sp.]
MSQCTLCGADFTCGQLDSEAGAACWCMALPPAVPVPGTVTAIATGCWCPACLQVHIAGLAVPPASGTPSK